MKTTVRTITPFDESSAALYQQLAKQHGHYCPMSTLGLRLGLLAVQIANGPDWQFCYYARTCAVDGIALALAQNGQPHPPEVVSDGQHSLRCCNAAGRELSLTLTVEAMRLAKQYHDLNDQDKLRQLELLRTVAIEDIIQVTGAAE